MPKNKWHYLDLERSNRFARCGISLAEAKLWTENHRDVTCHNCGILLLSDWEIIKLRRGTTKSDIIYQLTPGEENGIPVTQYSWVNFDPSKPNFRKFQCIDQT